MYVVASQFVMHRLIYKKSLLRVTTKNVGDITRPLRRLDRFATLLRTKDCLLKGDHRLKRWKIDEGALEQKEFSIFWMQQVYNKYLKL